MACLSVMEWQAVQGVLRFSSRSAGIGLLYACFLGGLTFFGSYCKVVCLYKLKAT